MEYPDDDMSESIAASTQADLRALEALQADVAELEHIEELLDRYNVFETIGFIGQELTHSRFLEQLGRQSNRHILTLILGRATPVRRC
jgi:hypothetical protein